MKTLIFVRHAKSTWDYRVDDIDRPLEEGGVKAAYKVAKVLKSYRVQVDVIYSSPAARALATCMIFLRELKIPYNSFYCVDDLYDFSGDKVLKFINQLNESASTVMLFGHNNAFTHLVNKLGSLPIENVPTAGLVELNFDTNSWKSLTKGVTIRTLFPKQL